MTLQPERCETCNFLWKIACPYYKQVEEEMIIGISCDSYIEFTSIVGCASHSNTIDRDKVLDEIFEYLNSDEGKRWKHLSLSMRIRFAEWKLRVIQSSHQPSAHKIRRQP